MHYYPEEPRPTILPVAGPGTGNGQVSIDDTLPTGQGDGAVTMKLILSPGKVSTIACRNEPGPLSARVPSCGSWPVMFNVAMRFRYDDSI